MSTHSASRDSIRNGIYGVLGSGIGYTQSPAIFRRVFDSLGWTAVYARFDLPTRHLDRFLRAAADARIIGFSVTKPYKRRVVDYCDKLDRSAAAVGAVNTIAVDRGRLVGYNTDVDGVVASLQPYRRFLRGHDAVILGAGGAARAVVYALSEHLGSECITIVARRRERGRRLLSDLARQTKISAKTESMAWSDPALCEAVQGAALVVNATPVGSGQLRRSTPLPANVQLRRDTVIFDLVYSPSPTILLDRARRARCRAAIDGWPMLVAQAEASFRIWTGRGFPAAVRRDLLQRKGIR